MSWTKRAMVISVFVMCMSFGMIMINTFSGEYAAAEGHQLVNYNITAPINYTSFGVLDTTQGGLNATSNRVMTFDKPEDVSFDFGFWQRIQIAKLIWEIFITSTYGFPLFVNAAFGMPAFFVLPLMLLINVSHILLILKIYPGIEF